jgi:hypothetical protein
MLGPQSNRKTGKADGAHGFLPFLMAEPIRLLKRGEIVAVSVFARSSILRE